MHERSYRWSLLTKCLQSAIGDEPTEPTIHPSDYYKLRYRSTQVIPPSTTNTSTSDKSSSAPK